MTLFTYYVSILLLLLDAAIVDHLPSAHPIAYILLCHTSSLQVLLLYINEASLFLLSGSSIIPI